MIVQRLATPTRSGERPVRRARMAAHGLWGGLSARLHLAKERREEIERQLAIIGRWALGLLPEEPAFQLLVGFTEGVF